MFMDLYLEKVRYLWYEFFIVFGGVEDVQGFSKIQFLFSV